MRDTTLYQHLLGLTEPWTVSRVDLDVASQKVDVWVEHPKGLLWPCPECGTEGSLHDHAAERVWRHLDSCQFQTLLHAAPPRVRCPEHGARRVRLPWAEPHARFTLLFEAFAIQVLQQTSIQAARKILRISWDEACYVMHRAVARGLARKRPRLMTYLGVDEKAAGRGQTNYVTIICDLVGGTVLDTLPAGEHKIVFDRFHLMKHMGEAVDKVRRHEHRALREHGDTRLAGTRYVWLYARENLPEKEGGPRGPLR